MHFFLPKWLPFSILDFCLKRSKNPKRTSRGSNEDNEFCTLNETKHNSENFDILYFIILTSF